MNDQASNYSRYHAGPDVDDSPITVTLSDGRVLAFVDYDYIREHPGSFMDPPTPAEVTVNDAWWVAPDGTETDLTMDELEAVHDGPEYDAILTVCQDIRNTEIAEEMDTDWGELTDD